MTRQKEQIAAAAGRRKEVVDRLERALKDNDHAWVICSFSDCTHFVKGHCDIYTVSNVPRMKPGAPCVSYEKRCEI